MLWHIYNLLFFLHYNLNDPVYILYLTEKIEKK